jgi:hypothetical protein
MIQYIIAAGIGAFLGSQSKKSKKSYAHGGEVQSSLKKYDDSRKKLGIDHPTTRYWGGYYDGSYALEDGSAMSKDVALKKYKSISEKLGSDHPTTNFWGGYYDAILNQNSYADGGEVKNMRNAILKKFISKETTYGDSDGLAKIHGTFNGDYENLRLTVDADSITERQKIDLKEWASQVKARGEFLDYSENDPHWDYDALLDLSSESIISLNKVLSGEFNKDDYYFSYVLLDRGHHFYINKKEPTYIKKTYAEGGKMVWVGDMPLDIDGREELTEAEAKRLAKEWKEKGYDDVVIDDYAKGGEVKSKLIKDLDEVRNKFTDLKLKADLHTEKGVAKFRKKAQPLKNQERKIEAKLTAMGHFDILPFAKGGSVKMKHLKSHYKNLPSYSGYKWRGFSNGKHSFVKKDVKGYIEIEALEEDLTNGNIEFMAENDLSNTNR